MFKILIADDEPRFRDYMKTVLDWYELGFEICAIVKNGEEALQASEEMQPDIALLDINMPRMDGITLTAKLRQNLKNILIVFITGYSEFEYARKALQLGVDEYILKPFSKEELTNIILKLKLKIEKRIFDEKYLLQDRQILREELLNEIINCKIPENMADFTEKLSHLDINFCFDHFLVSVIEIDSVSQMWTTPESIDLWKFGITNIVQDIVPNENKQHFVFCGDENRIISLLNLRDFDDVENFAVKYFEKVRDLVLQYFGFTITVGVGNIVHKLQFVSDSYRKALIAAQDKFISGLGQVNCFSNLPSQNGKAGFYRLDLNDKLLTSLRKNDRDNLKVILVSVKEDIREKQLSIDYAYTMMIGMLSICLSYITEMNCSIAEIFGEQFSPYQELYNRRSLDECFILLEDILVKTLEKFENPRSRKVSSTLRDVEEYIKQNYSDPNLTVETIASNVYFDASYIRRIFSKYMNCTISDYITMVRVKEAKKLMEGLELSITEVSERVGYNDPGYFSKCFKKYFKISPSKYMSQLQNGKVNLK